MAKKADLEAAFTRHRELAVRAGEAEAARDCRTALGLAESALTHLPGALAFQRRYADGTACPPPATDRVLRLAPPLFARRSLDAVQSYCDARSKPDRAAQPDLPDRIAAARAALAAAVRLWSELGDPAAPPPLHRPADPVAGLLTVWSDMGLVTRAGAAGAERFVPVTDLRRDAWGKCSSCGAFQRVPVVALLDPMTCRGCGWSCPFVISRRIL